jgi:hypothetical protein
MQRPLCCKPDRSSVNKTGQIDKLTTMKLRRCSHCLAADKCFSIANSPNCFIRTMRRVWVVYAERDSRDVAPRPARRLSRYHLRSRNLVHHRAIGAVGCALSPGPPRIAHSLSWAAERSQHRKRRPLTRNARTVDLVITPIGGFGVMVAEDALDCFVVKRFERWSERPRLLLRGVLNPNRSLANMLRGKLPWHRDSRPGVGGR